MVKVKAKKACYVYVLRTCKADMSSYGGFVWPKTGIAQAPDWDAAPRCEQGLHGLLRGEGESSHLNFGEDARWLVVKVRADRIVDLGGKVKFPRGRVVFCGDRLGATAFLAKRYPDATIHGGTSTSGHGGTSTSGDSGTSTSGDSGTSTSGDSGTSTSGDSGTSTSGTRGTSTSGYGGTSTSGNSGTSTSGDSGTSTSGTRGTSTSGTRGTSTSGDSGTSTSGNSGTSTSGHGGTSTSGDSGILVLRYWDGKRDRLVVGYVGEGDIEANTRYRLNEAHAFEEVRNG